MSEEAVDVSEAVTTGGGEEITGTPPEENWYDIFGDEGSSLSDYKTPNDMLKAYNHAQSMIGRGIYPPSEGADEQAWNDFYDKLSGYDGVVRLDPENQGDVFAKLGTPKDADGYKFNDVEGYTPDAESVQGFAEAALGANLTREQASAMYEWLAGNIAKETAFHNEQVDIGHAGLRREWGEAFDHNVNIANGALDELMDDDFMAFLEDSQLISHPSMIKAFNKLGKMMGEPNSEERSGAGVRTPAEYQAEIDELRSRDEYWDDGTPEQATLVKRVNELTQRMLAAK